MKISLVVATSKNGIIGKEGSMPWDLPEDLKNFKKITTTGELASVVMGRKTFESIGKALPGRRNYVLSKQNGYYNKAGKCMVLKSVDNFIEELEWWEAFLDLEHTVYVIGGASIYNQFLEKGLVEKIYHTYIDKEFEGDTRFEIPNGWNIVKEEKRSNGDFEFYFRELTKND
jgi:dihydrofolate reductase